MPTNKPTSRSISENNLRSLTRFGRLLTFQLTRACQAALSPRAHLATLTLVAVLQKAPAVTRAINALKFSIEPATRIFQKITVAAASLGAYQAVSGASVVNNYLFGITSPTEEEYQEQEEISLSYEVGDVLDFYFAIDLPGSYNAASWLLQGIFPSELTVTGRLGETLDASRILNSTFGFATGTLLDIGEYFFTLRPYEEPDGEGGTTDPLTITLSVTEDTSDPEPEPDPTASETPQIVITRSLDSLVARWGIKAGYSYQLQSSSNGMEWTNEFLSITQSGNIQSTVLPMATGGNPVLYRISANPI